MAASKEAAGEEREFSWLVRGLVTEHVCPFVAFSSTPSA